MLVMNLHDGSATWTSYRDVTVSSVKPIWCGSIRREKYSSTNTYFSPHFFTYWERYLVYDVRIRLAPSYRIVQVSQYVFDTQYRQANTYWPALPQSLTPSYAPANIYIIELAQVSDPCPACSYFFSKEWNQISYRFISFQPTGQFVLPRL